ncbi:TPA: conjugal transfer mating-pair stabilization protein TraG, partial [Shigella dysenteriae]
MNNPLEAVTQAVNSLVTALKLPDESAKANEVLGEMSFPQFSRLLPYRDYNQESGLFMNDTTMGFMLEAIPINGANESIVEALDHMLRTKLPRGVPFCIHLKSSQLVGDRIEYGLREFSWSGEQAERFNAITRAYYMNAAATQFPLPEGMNLPLTLRHYRVFFSYCSPSKKKSRADILEMENLVKIIRASLQGASIATQTVDAQAFIDIVGEMINHNPDSLYPKRRQLDPYSDLNYQCVEDSFDLKVRADYLTLGLRENGRNSTARILNFHLARNPEIAFLWNMADNYSNLLNPELSISCPFILTLTLVVEDQVKTHSEANLKYMDLEKKSKTSYAKWFPSVEKEAKEWGELRQRLGSGQSSVVSYFLNITAFCKDNNETALEVEQDILNSFRKNGFELISPRFNHMRNFLTCLPFMAGKGLFKQLKEAGVVQRAESFNVANLMPLVADNPLTPAGLLAPTYRNQLAFIDIFFRGMNNTNYNMAVCGTSGAGKTGLIQPLIRSVLDSGGFAVVFDMGDGYKSLCENMGGVYLDGETLRFNPFANITDIDQSAERVRDQLSVMASPNGNLDEVHEGLLLQAVRASWLAKENRARIDDVVDFLKNASDSEQYAGSPTIRSRLDEMIVLLDQYTANGTYGQYFNSDEPSLRDDAKMVVLELGGLEDRPSLLVAVMFSLIIYIENRMYRTPRNLKKLNVIDEGWRLLDFKNYKVGEFIEKGYRTARRHTGAYITITQNIVDFDSDKASSAARAAWGIGHAMVVSYEMIFTQPDSVTYSKTGMLFGANLIVKSTDFLSRNPEIINLFQDYVQNCVLGDIYLNHKYTLEDLMASADPYTLIFSRPSPLRGVYDNNNNFITCKDASVTLKDRLNLDTKTGGKTWHYYVQQIFGGRPDPDLLFRQLVSDSYSYFYGSSQSASQIMRQNVTINALKEGITSNAARNGDTASLVNLATTSSMEKQRLAHVSIGHVTMRNLPMVQTILTGIAIGIFPLLVLAAVFNKLTLSVLKGYVFALMWLQTWPLLYAILNSAMTFYAKMNGAPVVLSELSQIQLKYSDLASTAGYLSAMIPPLSWMMVKGLGAGFSSVYSHFASSSISPTASAAGSVVDGNYSYGNMQTENVNGFSWSTNSTTSFGQMMYQTGSGATATQTRDGNMVMDASGAMSRLPVGINATRQIAAAQQEMAREASNRAESALHGFSSSIASAWNTLSQFGSNRGSSDSVTGGADSTMSAQDSMMASRMRSAMESYAKAHNISNEQATQELASRSTRASAGMYGDAHAEWGVKPKILGVGGGLGVRGGGRAGIDWSDDDAHQASSGSRASNDARHDIDARATQDFKEASDYFTSRKVSESGSHTDNNADSRVDQLSAALNSAKQSYDQYTTNMTRSHEYAEMASRTESMSGQMSEDLSQQFAQYVMKHAPQDAEAILTNTSSPEIAERRRAMAWSFVQEQIQPGVDNAWRESRGDIGKGMESVPSGGGSQDIIADHQGHQAIIEQRTQDSNIR